MIKLKYFCVILLNHFELGTKKLLKKEYVLLKI